MRRTIEDMSLAAIAGAIRERGKSLKKMTVEEMPRKILSIDGDGAKDVNFYDYDGRLLYAFTTAEAVGMTELPPLPEAAGLICQGWNWTLADIKGMGRAVDVGASYITDNGRTRLYIATEPEYLTVKLNLWQQNAGGTTIYWGDGNTEVLTGVEKFTVTHTYGAVGEYLIELEVADGNLIWLGHSASYHDSLFGDNGEGRRQFLRKARLGAGISYVPGYAFRDCYRLETITIPENITEFSYNIFDRCMLLLFCVFPKTMTRWNEEIFINNYNLRGVSLPMGISKLYDGIFSGCRSIRRVIIPDGVTALGANAFFECMGMRTMRLPAGLTSIGASAFEDAYSLQEITIPEGVTDIGAGAFRNCTILKGNVLPRSLLGIGANAFQYCYSIEGTITLYGTLASVGEYAFDYLRSVKHIVIEDGITAIPAAIFGYCGSVRSVRVAASVTSIAAKAFRYCHSMQVYDFTKHTAVPTLAAADAFLEIPAWCEIRVPGALAEEWRAAANWADYASYIVGV